MRNKEGNSTKFKNELHWNPNLRNHQLRTAEKKRKTKLLPTL